MDWVRSTYVYFSKNEEQQQQQQVEQNKRGNGLRNYNANTTTEY